MAGAFLSMEVVFSVFILEVSEVVGGSLVRVQILKLIGQVIGSDSIFHIREK